MGNWQVPISGMFTDAWTLWLWHNYSILLAATPALVAASLKIVAVVHPGVPSDKIMCLVRLLFTRPNSGPQPDKEEEKK